jgi:hypothetical protein
MSKCPNCKKENAKPKKTWKYRLFDVQVFRLQQLQYRYNDYIKEGKHSFTLKKQKGKGYVKA